MNFRSKDSENGKNDIFPNLTSSHYFGNYPEQRIMMYDGLKVNVEFLLQWGAPYFVISEPENRTK